MHVPPLILGTLRPEIPTGTSVMTTRVSPDPKISSVHSTSHSDDAVISSLVQPRGSEAQKQPLDPLPQCINCERGTHEQLCKCERGTHVETEAAREYTVWARSGLLSSV